MTTVEEEFEIIGASTAGREDSDEERPRFIDWADLAEENAAVLISVIGPGETEDFGYGDVTPVLARVIVLTGEDTGSVYEDVRILKGGIRRKCESVPPGKHVVGRVAFYTKGEGKKAQTYIGLNDEKPGDLKRAKAAREKHGPVYLLDEPKPNGRSKAKPKDEDEEPRRSSTRSRKPTVVSDDDDEPPF